MEDKTVEKATKQLSDGIQQARTYCYEVLKSVSAIAPLQGHDLERAFVAGFQAGQLSPLSAEEVQKIIEVTRDQLAGVITDMMSDA